MKNKRVLLALLALCLAVTAVTGSAWAYFTTNTEAVGTKTLQLGSHTTIEEAMAGQWTKQVTITAQANCQPLYVRARAYVIADYPLTYAGEGWTLASDGWCYYSGQLANPAAENGGPKDTAVESNVLSISFNTDPTKYPEEFDVPVVYETAPVKYGTDGAAMSPTAANAEGATVGNPDIWEQELIIDNKGA